jgi:GntR family transcriptional regulator, trigonelline degradation regulator
MRNGHNKEQPMRLSGVEESGGRNAREGVVEALRDAIVGGEVPPGARIREVEIAARLGVSRTPVREAFLVLSIEGLLTLQAGRGARVRTYDAEEVRLVHDVRSLIEGRVARSAADHISNQQLAGLEECCARLEALPLGAVRECNAENVRFHNALFAIVGSDRLMHIGRHLLEVPLPYKENYWGDPVQKRCSEVGHREVLTALQARDGEAAERVMREHVQETGTYIATWMAKQAERALAAD